MFFSWDFNGLHLRLGFVALASFSNAYILAFNCEKAFTFGTWEAGRLLFHFLDNEPIYFRFYLF